MSTRAAIIIYDHARKLYRGIYSHSDGYPEYLGACLAAHYLDRPKVECLISLGDIDIIGAQAAPPGKSVTFAYMRDGGEKGLGAIEGATLAEVADQIGHNGHIYTFNENGDNRWTWRESPHDEPRALGDLLAQLSADGRKLHFPSTQSHDQETSSPPGRC